MVQSYRVQSGDTLNKISEMFYGDRSAVDIIVKANGIVNKDLIYVGQLLQLPGALPPAEVIDTRINANASHIEDAQVVKDPWPVPWYLWLAGAGVIAGGIYLYNKKDKKKSRAKAKAK